MKQGKRPSHLNVRQNEKQLLWKTRISNEIESSTDSEINLNSEK